MNQLAPLQPGTAPPWLMAARKVRSCSLGVAFLAMILLGIGTRSRAEIQLSSTTGSVYTGLFGTTGTHTRKLTMRVGSYFFGNAANTANISLVTFDVTGANVSPSPGSVAGIPSGHLPPTSGSTPNGVRIYVSNIWTDFSQNRVYVRADSQAGMVCTTAVTCGTTVIPFSKISWTSSQMETGTYAGQDFASGTFNGSASQTVLDFTSPNQRSPIVYNDWNFTYSNDTLYPAGSYLGRVTFTAFMP